MFWQNAALAFGVSIALRPAPWVGASLVAAQQSAPGSTCSNARRLRSARTYAGKELATFGTPPGRSEAAMRLAATRT
jgi:hypothetical protein